MAFITDHLVWKTYYVLLFFLSQCVGTYSQVSLYGNKTKHEGGIVIYHESQRTWNTLCGECWYSNSANVACRELGFSGGIRANVPFNSLRRSTGYFNCPTGYEANLSSCSFGTHVACNPCTEAAGVLCEGAVRLHSTNPPSEYKLVYTFGKSTRTNRYTWGSVCGECWTPINANITCTELGHSDKATHWTFSYVAPWNGRYQCFGNETALDLCQWSNHECGPCQSRAVVQCAVDGGWSPWGSYIRCSATCGDGHQTRTRSCNNPRPQHGGLPCAGSDTNVQTCKERECRIAGGWSFWGSYGPCSATCGKGQQTRTRSCDNPRPQHGGLTCAGNGRTVRTCNGRECPIDGGWSLWGSYGPCSASCDDGQQFRTRSCNNPLPQHGGLTCAGSDRTVGTCNERDCLKTWNESCVMDSDCAGDLKCKYNTTCDCRRETDVWDRVNMRCQSSLAFLAIYSPEILDFASATEYCTNNITGFLATRDYMSNMFITCMDTSHVIWLAETIGTKSTNGGETREMALCSTGSVNMASEMLITQVSCRENRHFVCVVNLTDMPSVTNETSCSGFRDEISTDKSNFPLGTIVAVAVTGVVVLLVAAVIICITRKRLSKGGETSGSSSARLEVNYSNDTPAAANEGGPDTDQPSYDVAGPSVDTDHYGYGILGKTSGPSENAAGIGDGDLYSHTKANQPLGDEYDVFVKKKENMDESDIYDHVRNGVMMEEGQYDEFQKTKL